MTPCIRILHLEDDDNDAELIAIHLASDAWPHSIVLAQTRNEFFEALLQGPFDVILADNSIPSFNGQEALAVAREKLPNAAFLFVSGLTEGDRALTALQSGSDGYVLKHELAKLIPAIERALESKKK